MRQVRAQLCGCVLCIPPRISGGGRPPSWQHFPTPCWGVGHHKDPGNTWFCCNQVPVTHKRLIQVCSHRWRCSGVSEQGSGSSSEILSHVLGCPLGPVQAGGRHVGHVSHLVEVEAAPPPSSCQTFHLQCSPPASLSTVFVYSLIQSLVLTRVVFRL